ncbi:hypothetical protein HKCCE3408_12755 [Rhodobacterales bacterium HKCCE3408]|nr:hypothetical protein [Rhodobacterales bacterium HKCCE3408]
MTDFLPEDVEIALRSANAARRTRRRHRMTIHVGEEVYPILQVFDRGFSLDAETAPFLRGFVDIFDGPRHMARALVVASSAEDGAIRYEYKRNTPATDRAPSDFERTGPETVGFLPVDL